MCVIDCEAYLPPSPRDIPLMLCERSLSLIRPVVEFVDLPLPNHPVARSKFTARLLLFDRRFSSLPLAPLLVPLPPLAVFLLLCALPPLRFVRLMCSRRHLKRPKRRSIKFELVNDNSSSVFVSVPSFVAGERMPLVDSIINVDASALPLSTSASFLSGCSDSDLIFVKFRILLAVPLLFWPSLDRVPALFVCFVSLTMLEVVLFASLLLRAGNSGNTSGCVAFDGVDVALLFLSLSVDLSAADAIFDVDSGDA